MAKTNYNFKELDIDELFRENTIENIIRIQKLIDNEIERKRTELRSMVGDRYKDILTASDAIKSMKSISETIVLNINELSSQCDGLIEGAHKIDTEPQIVVTTEQLEERRIVVQIHLTMLLNEQIWSAINSQDFSQAAQFYLLAQHVHTGLRLLKKDMIEKLPILKDIKYTLDELRNKILEKIKQKLENVALTPEEASNNLIAMILLQTDSTLDLLNLFMDLRRSALLSIINKQHESVRIQVASMVQCLITTVHLIHDCFLSCEGSKKGLLWQKLNEIILDNSPSTLSKVNIPKSPLASHIPEVVRNFRPKCGTCNNLSTTDMHKVIEDWLTNTTDILNSGLKKSLDLVIHMKGLHIIRQESLKIDLPSNWDKICVQINLPNSFKIWNYFFQKLFSNRAYSLICSKFEKILVEMQESIKNELNNNVIKEYKERDLRNYMWSEEATDISRTENKHLGLSMKTKGYSPKIVILSNKLNEKCLEFWRDIYYYFYGKEYDVNMNHLSYVIDGSALERKYMDKEKLEGHLKEQCLLFSKKLNSFLNDCIESEQDSNLKVLKSIICARFTQAILVLCPYLQKCCVFNNNNDEWERICNEFKETSLSFWRNWISHSTKETERRAKEFFNCTNIVNILTILPKWDTIEIQEQTDEKVFQSQIRVPSQLSLILHNILTYLCDNINSMLPHTLPKQVHLQYIEKNIYVIFNNYESVLEIDLNQNLSLQFLFDVKFLTTFCVPKENMELMQKSQVICDKLRSKVDPFDLDVFYSHIQNNVKQCVFQSQIIFGCLLPATSQLANLGVCERKKEERDPIMLALSIPSIITWFPLLPVTAPTQKIAQNPPQNLNKDNKVTTTASSNNSANINKNISKKMDAAGTLRSGAASLFGAMTTDWFS